jgi:ATP-dependent RNA helicase DeaD
MTQMMRDRVMNKFRKSGLEFLVATDVAARGIDVDDVEVVFNYDLPYDGEDYVHRIGRTGRKGRSGRAISFASGREVFQIRNIERYTNVRIQRGKPPSAGEVEEARTNTFLEKLRATLKGGEFKRQDHLVERLLEEGFNSTDIASALLHHLQAADGASAPKTSPEDRDTGGRDFRREDRRSGREMRPPPAHRRHTERTERPVAERPVHKPAPKPDRDRPEHPKVIPEHQPHQPAAPRVPKPSRATPEGKTRLYINAGSQMGITPGAVTSAILGETGLPANVVGTVDIRERHLFVEVESQHVPRIVSTLNRSKIQDHRVKVKVA